MLSQAQINAMDATELRTACAARGMSMHGGKNMMIGRLEGWQKRRQIETGKTASANGAILTFTFDKWENLKNCAFDIKIESPKIVMGGRTWHLDLYPNGHNTEYKNDLAAYLFCDDDIVETGVKFKVTNGSGTVYGTQTISSANKNWNSGWGWHSFCQSSGLAQSSRVVITAELTNKNLRASFVPKSEGNPSVALKNLWETKMLSDVTLSAEGEEFQTHKCLLSSSSPVFKAMLAEDGFSEALDSTVKIENHSKETVGAYLAYLYTGAFPAEKTEAVTALLQMADQYQFDALRTLCLGALEGSLSLETVLPILLVADRLSAGGDNSQATNTRKKALRFAGRFNFCELAGEPGYDEFLKNTMLLRAFAEAQESVTGKKRKRAN